jgi:selenide,water dikinase
VEWCADQSRVDKVILADAQTSGGLLVAVAAEDVEALAVRFAERGVAGVRIGAVTGRGTGRIVCRRD